MSTAAPSSSAPRVPDSLLAQATLLHTLPEAARAALATALQPHAVSAGAVIVRQGAPVDAYYLVGDGQIELWLAKSPPDAAAPEAPPWAPTPASDVLLARLGPGEDFGEAPLLLDTAAPWMARAATDAVCWTLDAATFKQLVHDNQGLAVAFQEEVALRGAIEFLGHSSAFSALPPDALRWLAARLQPVQFAAGAELVREGDPGDAFYVIRTGQAAVVGHHADGGEYPIATLGPGDPLGEEALLTGDPRSATVRATEPVEAYRLGRDDFLAVLQGHRDRARYFVQLAMLRQRPKRIAHARVTKETGRDGKDVYVIENTDNHQFVRVGEQGAFLWNLMDGEHTIRDLSSAYLQQYQAFGVQVVLQAVMQLSVAGFVEIQHVDRAQLGLVPKQTAWQRLTARLLPYVSHYYSLPDVDGWVGRVYQVVRPLYWRPVQVLLAVVILAGLLAYLRLATQQGVLLPAPDGSAQALAVLAFLSLLVQGTLHEMGHALTTKHFGRPIHRAGIGWYLFLPVGFTDTSAMWTEPRGPRATVDIAGPYVNCLLASLASIAVPFTSDPLAQNALFHFASFGFLLAVLNLNPLIELDGYYVLMDLLDMPNLRSKALAYLGAVLGRQQPAGVEPRLARFYLAYGMLALVYVVAIAWIILRMWDTHLRDWTAGYLPVWAADALGYLIAGVMVYLLVERTWADLRAGATRARQQQAWTAGA